MPRTARLRVERLEPRDVPAGNVTAVVTNGVLVLTGDEDSNQLTFRMAAGGVTLTPSGDTSVNGRGPNVAVPLAAATGLKADLGDGDDILTLDADADLALPRGAVIALGDGANALDLLTTGTLDLASLVVTGGDGADTIRVGGGAGNPSKIAGAASFSPGDGGGSTGLSNLALPGAAGLKVSAGAGDDGLTLTAVTVAKALAANLGAGTGNTVAVVGGSVGGLTLVARGGGLNLTDTTVNGNASFTTAAQATATLSGSTVTGTLTVKASQALVGVTTVNFYGTGAVGGLAVNAVSDAFATFRPGGAYTVARDVAVTSRNRFAFARIDGASLAARALAVGSRVRNARVILTNDGRATLAGNLTIAGPTGANLLQTAGGDLDAAGDVKVSSTTGYTEVTVSAAGLSARHLTATSGGDAAVLAQDGASTIDLAGRLTLTGQDEARFTQGSGAAMAVAGDLTVASRDSAQFTQSGAATTMAVGGNWTVRSDLGTADVSVRGKVIHVTGATTLDGGYGSITHVATTDLSTLSAPIRILGGSRISDGKTVPKVTPVYQVILNYVQNAPASAPGLVGQAVAIGFLEGLSGRGTGPRDRSAPGPRTPGRGREAGRPADIQIGSPDRPVMIDGGLLIRTGGSDDSIALRGVTVSGNTTIQAGSGNDTLAIDDSTFTGTFAADLGSGNDTIAIAQAAGSAAPVTFSGKATIQAGTGADTLRLGRLAGDANSKAVFAAAGSKVDAGTGKDVFDDELGQFEGLVLGTGIIDWDDPTV